MQQEGTNMGFYMLQGRYTSEAIKAMVANPQDRSKAAAWVAKAHGGKLHNYFMSMGDYDFMALMEFPNDEAAAATSMATASAGHIAGMKTTKLLTGAEAVKAMTAAGAAAKTFPAPKAK
jgi:uncharacterized protein with GYD domain